MPFMLYFWVQFFFYDSMNAKQTRTKCIIEVFGPDLNQENQTTSVKSS